MDAFLPNGHNPNVYDLISGNCKGVLVSGSHQLGRNGGNRARKTQEKSPSEEGQMP